MNLHSKMMFNLLNSVLLQDHLHLKKPLLLKKLIVIQQEIMVNLMEKLEQNTLLFVLKTVQEVIK
jgi:hypothetical protein